MTQNSKFNLHDTGDSNEQYYNKDVDTATFTLPVDIITVTPPGSAILMAFLSTCSLEQFYDYMNSHSVRAAARCAS